MIDKNFYRNNGVIQINSKSNQIESKLLVWITVKNFHFTLTDTGENVQKWTRVFSTRRWVILVARTRRKKREENSASTFGRFRLWTSFESSPVSVNFNFRTKIFRWNFQALLLAPALCIQRRKFLHYMESISKTKAHLR